MLDNIREAKIEKLNRLVAAGEEAYPQESKKEYTNQYVVEHFDELTEKPLTLAGRIKSMRVMGALAFVHIEDESGKIQILVKRDIVGDERFDLFANNIDMGDFIQATGTLFITKTGEKTLQADAWKLLAKTLLPIPSEFYGLKDIEALLRKRYLDLMMNQETRELFLKKTIFWKTIRTFLNNEGFSEVDTPALEGIAGGADARPFITHHNALDRDFFLRISLELPLKKMLVGGFEKIYEIGKVFRNEGIDAEHLQDYLAMEFYWAYGDMEKGMDAVERMYKEIVKNVVGEDMKTQYDDVEIDWSGTWPRVDYFVEFKKETGIDLSGEVSVEELKKKADELGIKYDTADGKGRMIDTIYKKTVRQRLIQPCFLVGHPLEVSPLAKKDPNDTKRVLRFQPIACKSELGNGFSELNDPQDQRQRFEEQAKLREAGDEEAQMLDEDFIEALEYGMPPAVGFGLSERLFSFLMNRSIRETVVFPPMKEEGEVKTGKAKETKIAVVVLNKGASMERWEEMNTVGHLNAAFAARGGKGLLMQDEIQTKDNQAIKLNIQHAILIKEAGSSEVIQKLIKESKVQKLDVAEFTREMLKTTNDKKIIEETKAKDIDDVEFLGALVFGEKGKVESLTKEFELYK
ncbi:MAG: Lysine-tRNA ligase [Candidatus Wolfebacteria bacterium GW2011_GWC2_39_22]|uniref:Lysine--tRNA ligase n=1 Tax=Candidatus Wolfebacteria bacterium GW2011_GWC2_39_22 TaxID=1619013 RepID=A0A0G0NBZ0_9BACT|nr:MAG: Lysine-tRNA ligase [Candidatus Wolfebacteria bacterium GW2011_GWC2_39_22]HBI25322.1 lysine--tRNA ligase [Candidatus Wolfebacteria bacterium]